ncbi:MAG: PLDc N-terminal domain-containing protein [Bowdeniella nasicola]|nr:PLDc N-terminal domain-containing protein [Bowdeniella nasicola]
MPRILPYILPVALAIYALADCALTPRWRVPSGLPKGLWIVLILVPVIGPIAWLVTSRLAGHSRTEAIRPPRLRRQRPVAPDDNEAFLADLDWQARKAHYERLKREREAAEQADRERRLHERDHDDEPPASS